MKYIVYMKSMKYICDEQSVGDYSVYTDVSDQGLKETSYQSLLALDQTHLCIQNNLQQTAHHCLHMYIYCTYIYIDRQGSVCRGH